MAVLDKFPKQQHLPVVSFEMIVFCVDRITSRARSLLKLVPTDPSVLDNLSALSQKVGIGIQLGRVDGCLKRSED